MHPTSTLTLTLTAKKDGVDLSVRDPKRIKFESPNAELVTTQM